jgi:hypothetical protein
MIEKYAFLKRYENLRFSNFPLEPRGKPRGILLIKSKISINMKAHY